MGAPDRSPAIRSALSGALRPTLVARSTLSCFFVGAVAAAAAVAVRLALYAVLGAHAPYLFSVMAVIIATWFAGWRAGAFCTVSGAGAVSIYLLPPRGVLHLEEPHEVAGVFAFLIVGFAISWIVESLRRANLEAERQTETARASEQRYKSLIEASTSVVWTLDAGANAAEPQPEFEAYTGSVWERYKGRGWVDAFHPDDRETLLNAWRQALAEASQWVSEVRAWRRASHDYRWCLLRAVPIRDAGGGVREWIGTMTDVHEQRAAQEALRSSETRLRIVTNSLPALVSYVDRLRRFEFANRAYEEWFGSRPAPGQAVSDFLGEKLYRSVSPRVTRALSGEPVDWEGWIELPRGRRFVRSVYVPDAADSGEVLGTVALIEDLTEVKLSEMSLREASERLRFHVENTPLAVIEFAADYSIARWSRRAEEIFGWTAAEMLGRKIQNLRWVHEEDASRVAALSADMAAGQSRQNVHVNRNYRKDGAVIHCEWYNSALVDADGKLQSVFSLVLDVTARRELEQRVEKLNEDLQGRVREFETLLRFNPVGIAYSEDAECRVIRGNEAFARILGVDAGANISKSGPGGDELPFIVYREGREVPPPELPMQRAARDGRPVLEEELEIVGRKDGRRTWLLCYATPLFDGSGAIRGSMGAFVDVTDLKRTERELRESQSRFEMAQEAGRIGVFDWDLRANRVIWTPQLERLFGLAPGTYEGTIEAWAKRTPSEDLSRVNASLAKAFAERRPSFESEFRAIRSDGEIRWIYCKASTFYGEDGTPLRMIGVNVDITDRKQMEEQLRRSNADLTQFAYAASHDLQEPLRMMASFSELLIRDCREKIDERASGYASFIAGGALRMRSLLRDLLLYSRLNAEHTPPPGIDCASALNSVLSNLTVSIEESGAEIHVAECLPRLWVHEAHLVQLLQNLVSNAIRYRRDGVPPVIEIGMIPADPSQATVFVRDNGCGIDPRYHEYVFGMFKRLNRSDDGGTGLGLALCRRIVEIYAGRIWLESDGRDGSTFYFTLPAAP